MFDRAVLSGLPFLCRWAGAAMLSLGLPMLAAAEPDSAKKPGDPSAIESRTEKSDGSTALTVGRRLQTEWDAKLGVDVGLAAPLSTTPSTEAFLGGWAKQDRSSGVGWASVLVPVAPLGWDKAAVDARIDPAQDQGKLTTTLSRSLPLGDDARVTIRHGYSVTESLANPGGITPSTKAGAPGPAQAGQTLATESQVSFDLLPSDTTFAAGAKYSNTDDKWLRTLSAEQKLFGSPLSVTGAISERPTGETDRSIKAGFKGKW